jgi:hypothetical protein
MISSFTVGSVFKIIDEASPTRKRRRLIRERVPADHGISRLNCS